MAGQSKLQRDLHEIIFEAETPRGKLFDVGLLIIISLSLFVVIIESVPTVRENHGAFLLTLEWFFTALFTIEYGLRLYSAVNTRRYALSFYGVVDLLAILPTYLSIVIGGSQSLLVIRGLRLLRLFRIFKLARFSTEAEILTKAIIASRPKITVFLGTVITVVIIMGSLMYLIEGQSSGFVSIPDGMYWAIVTMTTVGYGDLVPQTIAGKIIASIIMVMGYGLIAVPTGIVSVELAHASKLSVSTRVCPHCHKEGHDLDALYCRFCGNKLVTKKTKE